VALELRQRSLEIAEETGNQHDIAWASWEMGEIYRLMGNLDMAERYYRVAQPSFEMMQEFIGMGFYHRGLGDIAAMQGDWEQAKKQYLEALMYHEKEERGNRGWGLALTNARMGIALVETRQLEDARQYLKTSLAQAVSWKFPDLKALPLAGIARWLAVNGLTQRAVELAACVASKPTTWNEIKYQARTVLEGAKITLLADESRRWEETGAKMKIDEACDKYGDKGGF
jgi:tetratricopeptide (TPR) repeat protein